MDVKRIHTIEPARLMPGVRPEDIPEHGHVASSHAGEPIRGRALVFWDPENPGKKLDAIDTDQITPAKDCVSELSLIHISEPTRQLMSSRMPSSA